MIQPEPRPWGLAFFHAQDADHAIHEHEMYIGFASAYETKTQIEVGQAVKTALELQGLDVVWNESSDRLMIPNFDVVGSEIPHY